MDYSTFIISEDHKFLVQVFGKVNKKFTDSSFLEAIRRSVTKWMNLYEGGKKAFAYAGEDFNLGDLMSYQYDRDLWDTLIEEGIYSLNFDTFELNEANPHWLYDTHLVNEDDLIALKNE